MSAGAAVTPHQAANDVGDEEGACPHVPFQTSLGQFQLGLRHEYTNVPSLPLTSTSASRP